MMMLMLHNMIVKLGEGVVWLNAMLDHTDQTLFRSLSTMAEAKIANNDKNILSRCLQRDEAPRHNFQ